jgi:hypothetical protein
MNCCLAVPIGRVYEVDVAAQPIEIRNYYGRLRLAGGREDRLEFGPLLVVILATLDLPEEVDDLQALLAAKRSRLLAEPEPYLFALSEPLLDLGRAVHGLAGARYLGRG